MIPYGLVWTSSSQGKGLSRLTLVDYWASTTPPSFSPEVFRDSLCLTDVDCETARLTKEILPRDWG